jgi:phage FluMu gp28-like protein
MKININNLFDKQKEIIKNIIDSSAKYHIINASRQSSKTFTLSRLALLFGLSVRKDLITVISPTYDQVRIIYDNIINMENIDNVMISKKDSKPYEINLITKTRLSFKSADRPYTLRGASNMYVLIDEFAFIKPNVFESIIRPTTAAKKGSKIIIASTPKGTINDFYNMAQLGKSNDENYIYHFMHYSDNPFYDLKEIEDAKLRLPSQIYRQEYEADFIDSGGDVFENLDDVSNLDNIQFEKGKYFAGIDWGRADDKTVLSILNSNRELVFSKSFSGDWNKQMNDLYLIINKYKPIVYAESNGIGDPLLTQLKTKYSNVQPFITTNQSKRDIIEQLRMLIVLNQISLPKKELNIDLYKELQDYTFSITKTGLITYHHRIGGHDDFVDSLAIANYCYDKHNNSFNPQLIKHQRTSNFYQ